MSDRFEDPVVAEIHAVRAEMLAAAGGDVKKMMQGVIERQRNSTHRIITRPFTKQPLLVTKPEASKSAD
jgi:hypothetical protein